MRRRILLLVSGVTLVVVLAFAVPLAVLIDSQVVAHQRNATSALAQNVAAYVGGVVSGPGTTEAQARRTIRNHLAALDDEGRRVTVAFPDQPGDPDRGPGDAQPPSTSLRPADGGLLATTSVPSPAGPYEVTVFASDAQLHAGEVGWWLLLGGASVALLVLGVVAGEIVTRRITRPLVQAADTALRLGAGDVEARAPVDGPPEVAAVGQALNRLADRIDQLIAAERETVADLSHRMRSPLTALRLDAEALRDPVEAELIGTHVGALDRTLTAVIRAARRPQREGRMPACDAAAVVRDRVEFWSALTEEQKRPATIDIPPGPVPVRSSGEDLVAAVDALLENVVAHTPEGTAFSVLLLATDEGATLEIADAGDGLPADAVRRGRSDRGSTGLGLDIARRCAEATGGAMEIARSESGGALVRLRLGAP